MTDKKWIIKLSPTFFRSSLHNSHIAEKPTYSYDRTQRTLQSKRPAVMLMVALTSTTLSRSVHVEVAYTPNTYTAPGRGWIRLFQTVK